MLVHTKSSDLDLNILDLEALANGYIDVSMADDEDEDCWQGGDDACTASRHWEFNGLYCNYTDGVSADICGIQDPTSSETLSELLLVPLPHGQPLAEPKLICASPQHAPSNQASPTLSPESNPVSYSLIPCGPNSISTVYGDTCESAEGKKQWLLPPAEMNILTTQVTEALSTQVKLPSVPAAICATTTPHHVQKYEEPNLTGGMPLQLGRHTYNMEQEHHVCNGRTLNREKQRRNLFQQKRNTASKPRSKSTSQRRKQRENQQLKNTKTVSNRQQSNRVKLAAWLLDFIERPGNHDMVKWADRSSGVFQVLRRQGSKRLAENWGEAKQRNTDMNYEKLSRAIRDRTKKHGEFEELPHDGPYPRRLHFKFCEAWLQTHRVPLTT